MSKKTQQQTNEIFPENDLPLVNLVGTLGTVGTSTAGAALNCPHQENLGGDSGDKSGHSQSVTLTLITSKDALSKRYAIDNLGNINKSAKVDMIAGTAERKKIPFSQLPELIANATPKQAFVLGTHAFDYPDKVNIRVAGKDDPAKNILARTQKYFSYPQSPGVVMLDHDPSAFGRTFTTSELLEVLIAILPAFGQAAHFIKPSVSAGVHKKGELPKPGSGFHLYIPVKNAADIPRFGKVLFSRLWLVGHGFIALSKCGGRLLRSPIDQAVFSPERPDFICPPVIQDDRLEYTPGETIYSEGEFIDTAEMLDLSDDEAARLKDLIEQAKQAITPKSKEVETVWAQERVAKMIEKGTAPEKAQAVIDQIIKSGFRDLYGDFELELAHGGGTVTVSELLKNPGKYGVDKAGELSLPDPIEGREYGEDKAKFYFNKGVKPFINSFAHGEQKYFLHANLPSDKPASSAYPDMDARPCYRVFSDWWLGDNDKKNKPGVWFFSVKQGTNDAPPQLIDCWLCGEMYIPAIARDKNNRSFGNILKFKNKLGVWQHWNMPTRLMAGSGEEILKEILDMGIDFNRQGKTKIIDYINSGRPETVMWSADKVGWFDGAFVLPDDTIGADDVMFQSDSNTHQEYNTAGALKEWQDHVSALCVGNPLLVFSVAASFAGALLKPCNIDGIGVHFYGQSSQGKTSTLKAATSTWGGWEKYKRVWKTTANGLEGAATLFNDGLLCLDEIGDGDAKEISESLYMLSNGTGKLRANVTGRAREVATWRNIVLSNGEYSIESHLAKKGIVVQAGQLVRFCQIPIFGEHGAFDNLHHVDTAWEFSNLITKNAGRYHGTAGRAFLEKLIKSDLDQLPVHLHTILEKFSVDNGELSAQEARAAKAFALVALAGELATDYDITGWPVGTALGAALQCYKEWRKARGKGDIEPMHIKEAVTHYTELYGDARFTSTTDDTRLHGERSGYYRTDDDGERIWLFSAAGLKQATKGLDFKAVIAVLKNCGWLQSDGSNHNTLKIRVKDSECGSRFYAVKIGANDAG